MVLWLKGLAIGFAIGTVTMSAVMFWSHGTGSAEPGRSSQAEARGLVGRLDSTTPPVARVQALAAEEQAGTDGAAALVAVPSPAPATEPTESSRGRRADELSALNSARAALAARNPKAALVELEHYERKYPSLSFGLRAQLLRIEALSAAGRPRAARELAATYLTTYPDSPHAPQLRAFVAGEAWAPQ